MDHKLRLHRPFIWFRIFHFLHFLSLRPTEERTSRDCHTTSLSFCRFSSSRFFALSIVVSGCASVLHIKTGIMYFTADRFPNCSNLLMTAGRRRRATVTGLVCCRASLCPPCCVRYCQLLRQDLSRQQQQLVAVWRRRRRRTTRRRESSTLQLTTQSLHGRDVTAASRLLTLVQSCYLRSAADER